MKYQNSIRFKFRMIYIAVFLLVTITLSLLFLSESMRITKVISKDYAQLYTNEIVGDIHAHLNREIALAVKAAQTSVITDWMKDEHSEPLKKQAYNEIVKYNNVLLDKNMFIAIEKSKNFYFVDQGATLQAFNATGVLSEDMPADKWYFKTLEVKEPYLLNIDTDRFLKTLRAWVNVRVVEDNKVIGVMGTGLYLDPFIRDIFEKRRAKGVKSVIINEFGAIQMDSNLENIRENSFESNSDMTGTIYQFFKHQENRPTIENYLAKSTAPMVLELNQESYSYVAFAPIRGTKWHVVTFFDAGTLFVISHLYPFLGMILMLFLALAVVLNLVIQRVLIRPFREIQLSIQEAGSIGNQQIYGLDRTDEFGLLARAVQEMKLQLGEYSKNLESQVAARSEALESAYAKIAENENRLERLFDNIPVGIFTLDAQYAFSYGNPAFLKQFGCESEREFKAKYANNYHKLFVESRAYDLLMTELKKNPEIFSLEVQLNSDEAGPFWADIRFSRINSQSEPVYYEGLLINIQVKKDYEMKLLDRANLDRLTGIYNRHFLDNFIQEEINRSCRYDEPIALMVFDLDRFKLVNDTWGHHVGDEVLKNTVRTIQKLIRRSDVLCRWGGEEFVIVMPHTALNGAAVLAEKMRKALAVTAHTDVGIVTASFGVSEYQSPESFEDWFKRADEALFDAKNAGRNRVSIAEGVVQSVSSFVKLIWKSQFECGNEQIDKDHKMLFELANDLMTYMIGQNSIAQQLHQFDLIVDHVVKHFESEEAIMRESNYPDWLLHQSMHQSLIQKLSAKRIKLFNGEIKGLEVFNFIIDEVIVNHLLSDDTKYFTYLADEPQPDN